jgi:hypothetical protein
MVLHHLRIATATLLLLTILPLLYIGRKLCGSPQEGAEYDY